MPWASRQETTGLRRIHSYLVAGEDVRADRAEGVDGRIESSWTVDRGLLRLDVTVPPGTTAEVVLPGRPARRAGPGRHSFQALVESAPC